MKLFISLGLLMLMISISAQNPVRDVIYLNNGSIIRGNIIEISGNKTIKIESCENILVFDMADVQKVAKEEFIYPSKQQDSLRKRSYVNITSFGVLAGPKENSSMSPLSIETVNAFLINNKYTAGIGLGFDLYEKVHVPVFLDLRYQVMNRDISPVILFKGGYALPVGKDDSQDNYYQEYYSSGGPMLGAGAGLLFRINNNNLITLTFAYRYQELTTTEVQRNNDNKWEYDHTTKYNRLEIKFGFCFE